jgi:hypothetical protein
MITLNMIEAMTEYEVIVDAFKEINNYDEHSVYILTEALEFRLNLLFPIIDMYAESVTQQTDVCQVTIKDNK